MTGQAKIYGCKLSIISIILIVLSQRVTAEVTRLVTQLRKPFDFIETYRYILLT